jgi:hypothetical protein
VQVLLHLSEVAVNVLLLNDTATVPHVGCQAVSDAHARLLGEAGHRVTDRAFLGELRRFAGRDEEAAIRLVLADAQLRERLEACDSVVVNGEGTLHHGSGAEYFAVLGAAQRLGKATLIVNAVFEAHAGWQQVLTKLDDFCVRDRHSLDHARSHGLRCRLVPDSFLAAQFDAARYVDLSEQIVVTDWHPLRDGDVGQTMRTLLGSVESTFYFPLLHGIHAQLWRGAADAWSGASLIVTGRHHGIYLAAIARRPFIALPSNTRKVEGLIASAGADIPVCVTTADVEAGVSHAMHNLGEYERLFDWLSAQLPLSTFAALGRTDGGSDAASELVRLAGQRALRGSAATPAHWGLGNGKGAGLTSLG